MPNWLERFIALIALILLSPLFLLIMLAIVIDSPGWPFFSQRRVGKDGIYFWMLKFRKMYNFVPKDGKGITTKHDVRLTRMGRYLERFKLDELPQIINVLLGHMALIGPRPEIPRFTVYYPEKWKKVLSIRPGLVGYSQITTPHEMELYPRDCLDHEKYYVESILPDKLDNEIKYVKKKSCLFDISIIFGVFWALLTKTINRNWILVHLSHAFILIGDTILSCSSLFLAYILVFQMGVPENTYNSLYDIILYALIIRPAVFFLFGLQKYPISSTITVNYLLAIVKASFYSTMALIMVLMFSHSRDLVLSAHIVDAFLLPFLLTSARVAYIYIHDSLLAAGSHQSIGKAFTHFLILCIHGALGFFSFWLAHIIHHQELNIYNLLPRIGLISLMVVGIRTFLAFFLWPPKAKTWRSFIGRDVVQTIHISLIGTGLILLAYLATQSTDYSRFSLILDTIIYSVLSSILILFWCHSQITKSAESKTKRVFILGVGIESELLLSTLHRIGSDTWEILGIVTDIEWKRFSSIAGYKIIGTIQDLESLFEVYKPDILLTWEWAAGSQKYEDYIKSVCKKHNVLLSISPSIRTLIPFSEQPVPKAE